MAKKYTFKCHLCDFQTTCDRVPLALFHCCDCALYIGICRRCINLIRDKHRDVSHLYIPGSNSNAADLFRRENSSRGA